MAIPATVKGRIFNELLQESVKYLTELEKENIELKEEIEALKSNTMPPILSVNFIKDYTGVSASTIAGWLTGGELKGSKKGGRWLVRREDFLIWLNEPLKKAR